MLGRKQLKEYCSFQILRRNVFIQLDRQLGSYWHLGDDRRPTISEYSCIFFGSTSPAILIIAEICTAAPISDDTR
ncbi:hypothetical protein L873DRAFT_1800811 [Choiromyces venosus 120613-1]|uniref:Uncharacterized protein n=1 Tax=Choiromyces venosus 120613-1 TaxID=1336337 RepID=A0A3N4K159_9PEZI|nr:hypothetical protein L873DRAFT_1800811 [Choiromyces venosus 120613-1]